MAGAFPLHHWSEVRSSSCRAVTASPGRFRAPTRGVDPAMLLRPPGRRGQSRGTRPRVALRRQAFVCTIPVGDHYRSGGLPVQPDVGAGETPLPPATRRLPGSSAASRQSSARGGYPPRASSSHRPAAPLLRRGDRRLLVRSRRTRTGGPRVSTPSPPAGQVRGRRPTSDDPSGAPPRSRPLGASFGRGRLATANIRVGDSRWDWVRAASILRFTLAPSCFLDTGSIEG
jgi:hypothetical protein